MKTDRVVPPTKPEPQEWMTKFAQDLWTKREFGTKDIAELLAQHFAEAVAPPTSLMKQGGSCGAGSIAAFDLGGQPSPRPADAVDKCSVKACPYPASWNGLCRAHAKPAEHRAPRGKSWMRFNSNPQVRGYGVVNDAAKAKYSGK